MRILFCYATVLAIAGVAAYVIGSVVWHVIAGIPAAFEDDGEEIPEDPDRERDWDIADEMGAY